MTFHGGSRGGLTRTRDPERELTAKHNEYYLKKEISKSAEDQGDLAEKKMSHKDPGSSAPIFLRAQHHRATGDHAGIL
jgi:hypothetical protein